MKIILFDADGVVLKKGTEYFSQRFAREHGAPIEPVTNFFKTKYRLCQVNKLDLKQELTTLLSQWGWQDGVDEFLDYWFAGDVPDQEVLVKIQEFRARGIECFLATDQEKYRAQSITNKLQGKLDGFWYSSDLGYSKEEPGFFKEILRRWDTRYKPHEIVFWDDDMKNVECAKSVGIDARFYNNLADLKI